MKGKEPYIIISLISLNQWFTYYSERNIEAIDDVLATLIYFCVNGVIISLVGWFMYTQSNKDWISKFSLFLLVSLGASQVFGEFYSYYYRKGTEYLPWLVGAVTVLEIYKFVSTKQWFIDAKNYITDIFIKLVKRHKK